MSCLDHFHYCIIKSMHQSLYKTHDLYINCALLTHVRALIVITFSVYLSELVPPNVAIATNGTQTIRVSYEMTCTVNVLYLMVPNTMIQWVKTLPNNTILSSTTARTTSIYYIEELNTSDAGLYTCIATITIPDIGLTVQGNDSHVITLTSKQINTFLFNIMEHLLISFSTSTHSYC